MPSVIFYREDDGKTPILEWFGALPKKARLKCITGIELLEARGYELRRPHADYLRDGIHELRAKSAGIHYRMLCFFHGRQAVVLTHGVTKQRSAVPTAEIERARRRRLAFEADPQRHTHRET